MAFGISVDRDKFRRNLIFLAALSSAKKEVWPILDGIGEGRMKALIDKGEPLLESIPVDKLPPKLQNWLALAPGFRNMIVDLNETAILALLPPWLQDLILRDEQSKKWFLHEVVWLISKFDPQPEAPISRRVFRTVKKEEVEHGKPVADPAEGAVNTGGLTERVVERPGGGDS